MTVQEMMNEGMLTRQEAEALSSSRGMAEYNNSSHGNSEWEGQFNNMNNLKSSLANIISNVYTAPEGTFTSEQMEVAKGYMEQMQEHGGIENMPLSRVDVNTLLTQAQSVVEHNPEYLGEDWDTVEAAAFSIQNNETDSETYERIAEEGVAERNVQKPYDPQDHIEINQATNQAYYRDESGQLQEYHSPDSEEGVAQLEAESNAAFLASDGAQDVGMFSGLTDR